MRYRLGVIGFVTSGGNIKMKKKIIGIFVCMLLIGATTVALADWDEGEPFKMHWPQLPDPNGFDVDWGWWALGDDWQCIETGPVDDIHFWISWCYDDPIDIPWIDVSIWSNNPDGPGGHSEPLDLKWERTFYPHQFTMRHYGDGDQLWMMPWGEIIPLPHQGIYQINIKEIDDPFEQIEGEIYWLVIKMPFEDQFIVGWKTTKDYFMDHAVWSEEPGYAWMMIDGIDFAFVITGEPPPPPECCITIVSMDGGLLGSPAASLKVNAVIKNTGDAECKNVNWSFDFTGLVLWGSNSGTESSILPGATVNVSSKIVIGLAFPGIFAGNVTLTADASNNACPPATMTKEMILIFLLFKVV